jgi:MoaA/NifB/PqqE/SkfB family radical SAM enzyme
MSRQDILDLINRIAEEMPHVRFVVFSGGEVTLLRDDLLAGISLLTKLGLGSRVVSNGHWGRSDKSAEWWVEQFLTAGLCELNLSTGDEHQEFVPFDSVARAASHAVRHGLLTMIVVEGKDTAKFDMEELRTHPLIAEILNSEQLREKLILLTNIWMPFHTGTDITNENIPDEKRGEGCENIFDNFVVNPYGYLMSCCGLTMEYIPELKVGHINSDHLQEIYSEQYNDLLKLWIWLDGTKLIFDRAVAWAGLDKKMVSPHICSICAQIFRDPDLRKAVDELVVENAQQIVFRSTIKARLTGRLPDLPTVAISER